MPTTPMRSRDVWDGRLQSPFVAVGDHVGVELPGGRALFTTRRGGVSAAPFDTLNVGLLTGDDPAAVEENRDRLAALIGIPRERWLEIRQVHGPFVVRATELPGPDAQRPQADGVATPLQDAAALVVTADCLPVALVAREAVAMVHAGWRGLAAGVLAEGVRAMRGVGAEGEIEAAIGPGIGACCYEVDARVHRALARYRPPGAPPPGDRADLKQVARGQLRSAGVERVHDVGICTMCAPRSLFHSHRRDHAGGAQNIGRQASAAWRVTGPGGDWPS
jgi:polyphenol oxidase